MWHSLKGIVMNEQTDDWMSNKCKDVDYGRGVEIGCKQSRHEKGSYDRIITIKVHE